MTEGTAGAETEETAESTVTVTESTAAQEAAAATAPAESMVPVAHAAIRVAAKPPTDEVPEQTPRRFV